MGGNGDLGHNKAENRGFNPQMLNHCSPKRSTVSGTDYRPPLVQVKSAFPKEEGKVKSIPLRNEPAASKPHSQASGRKSLIKQEPEQQVKKERKQTSGATMKRRRRVNKKAQEAKDLDTIVYKAVMAAQAFLTGKGNEHGKGKHVDHSNGKGGQKGKHKPWTVNKGGKRDVSDINVNKGKNWGGKRGKATGKSGVCHRCDKLGHYAYACRSTHDRSGNSLT